MFDYNAITESIRAEIKAKYKKAHPRSGVMNDARMRKRIDRTCEYLQEIGYSAEEAEALTPQVLKFSCERLRAAWRTDAENVKDYVKAWERAHPEGGCGSAPDDGDTTDSGKGNPSGGEGTDGDGDGKSNPSDGNGTDGDTGDGEEDGDWDEDWDGESNPGEGDGDGTDGEGEGDTGDGEGEGTDGEGTPTEGEGDGTPGEGEGEGYGDTPTEGEGEGTGNGEGYGDTPTEGDGEGNDTPGDTGDTGMTDPPEYHDPVDIDEDTDGDGTGNEDDDEFAPADPDYIPPSIWKWMCILVKHNMECPKEKVNIILVGPKGVGKTEMCHQLNMKYFPEKEMYALNSPQQDYEILGYQNALGVDIIPPYMRGYIEGGIITIDEIDASQPEAVLKLNMSLANHYIPR